MSVLFTTAAKRWTTVRRKHYSLWPRGEGCVTTCNLWINFTLHWTAMTFSVERVFFSSNVHKLRQPCRVFWALVFSGESHRSEHWLDLFRAVPFANPCPLLYISSLPPPPPCQLWFWICRFHLITCFLALEIPSIGAVKTHSHTFTYLERKYSE